MENRDFFKGISYPITSSSMKELTEAYATNDEKNVSLETVKW